MPPSHIEWIGLASRIGLMRYLFSDYAQVNTRLPLRHYNVLEPTLTL